MSDLRDVLSERADLPTGTPERGRLRASPSRLAKAGSRTASLRSR